MTVKEVSGSEVFSENHDYRGYYRIDINGKKKMRFLDGEPEDAILINGQLLK